MAVEDDTLKTLMRIEKLLSSSSQSTGFGGTASTSGGRAGTQQQRRAANTARGDQKTFQGTSKSIATLGDRADDVSRRFGKLSKTVYATQGQFVALNRSMRVFARATPNTPTPYNSGGARGTPPSGSGPFAGLGPAGRQLTGFGKGLSLAKTGLIDFAVQLSSMIAPVAKDFYLLQSRGIDAGSSLLGLYGNAIKAGVSLEEYTKILEANSPAVVRAGSFSDFSKTLDSTRAGLNKLGVFGEDATKLSATMANSATTLGVPQAQLRDATSRQVSVFDELRKTSMITADQFAKLNESLAENENVQGELLGLSGSERSARLQELQRTNAIGVAMGLSAKASQDLGNALIAQRKLTTVQRFQAAGTVRQAGAILGMGSGETEELAMLSRKKNRTADEQARFTDIGGRMQQRLEQFQNSEDPNRQFIADQLQERLGPISGQLEAAGKARLTSESGPVINSDIGKNTSDTAINVKNIYNWLSALGKNPIYSAVTAALGSAAFTLALGAAMKGGLGPLSNVIMKSVGLGNVAGIGKNFVGPKQPLSYRVGKSLGSTAGNIANVAGDFLGLAKSALPKFLVGIFKKIPIISFLIDAVSEVFSGDVAAAFSPDANWVERIGNAIWAGLTGIIGGITGIADWFIEKLGGPANMLTNFWDQLTSIFRYGFFTVLANLSKAVTLGSDNAVSKYFQESADGAKKVVDELAKDQSATVSSIGQKNKKMLDDQKKSADAALDSTGKVINTTKGLTALAVQTAGNVAIASPGATSRSGVTPPEVNTPANQTTTTAAGATPTAGTNTGNPALPADTLNTQIVKIIELLTNLLATGKIQEGFALQMLRATGRPVFSDTDRTANTLLASD